MPVNSFYFYFFTIVAGLCSKADNGIYETNKKHVLSVLSSYRKGCWGTRDCTAKYLKKIQDHMLIVLEILQPVELPIIQGRAGGLVLLANASNVQRAIVNLIVCPAFNCHPLSKRFKRLSCAKKNDKSKRKMMKFLTFEEHSFQYQRQKKCSTV